MRGEATHSVITTGIYMEKTVLGWDCERQGNPEELIRRRLRDPAAAVGGAAGDDTNSAANGNK